MESILLGIGAAIAFTQACIAFAVFRHSHRQRLVDRGTQQIIRIHDWGNDCVDALAEAGQFCLLQKSEFPNSHAYAIQKSELLHRLSALIDRGRLFYGNVDQGLHGLHKFPARRGYRPEILDPLVAAYRSVLEMFGSANEDRCRRLYEWRGRFITLLQCEVDPSWLQKARYYSTGPGAEAGISVSADSEPPKWPKGRPLIHGDDLRIRPHRRPSLSASAVVVARWLAAHVSRSTSRYRTLFPKRWKAGPPPVTR